MPVDWSRSTLAHLRSVYPFHTAAGFGERGVLLGSDVTGGFRGFYFDPFEFYQQRHLTNPNMIVMGSVGFGKSATVKALIRRLQAVYGAGRYMAIIDPKGEYSTVAADLGLAVIKLFPGEGGARVNPMDPGSTANDDSVIARQTLAAQLVAGVLGRELTPLEDAVLSWGIETRCRANQAFTLADLHREILDPPDELVRLSRHTPLELARATSPVTFALDKLCSRTLRGMFDGPTTVHVDWDNGPGVVLDLSAVYANSEALPLVMVAATHWLNGAFVVAPNDDPCKSSTKPGPRCATEPHTSRAHSSCPAPTGSPPCSSAIVPPTSPHKPTTAPRRRRSPPGCCPTSRPACCCANRLSRSPQRSRCSTSPNVNAIG